MVLSNHDRANRGTIWEKILRELVSLCCIE